MFNISTFLKKLRNLGIPERKLLEWFPPFWFMGVKVRVVAADYRFAEIRVPLRWYGKNLYGSMFGGWISSATDPVPALLTERYFSQRLGKEVHAWTKSHKVTFLKPSRSEIAYTVYVENADIAEIEPTLREKGQVDHLFHFPVYDSRERIVAEVENTVFLRVAV